MKPAVPSKSSPFPGSEDGFAVLIAFIALSIFSLVALFLSLNATTEVRISDNFESEVQAGFAARAGMNHARELMIGLNFNDLLQGPDGTYNNNAAYLTQARAFSFRNPFSWQQARSLGILNPAADLSGIPDDGLMNSGKYGTTNGTILVPLVGTAQSAPNPYGAGNIVTSRYFVKVTDNNGEASELANDAADDPFVDGDHIIVVRSIGVSQTIHEVAGGNVRRNSVAAVECRFRQRQTFDLDAPVVVEGNDVQPAQINYFNGNSFDLDGGASNPGLATIDVNAGDGVLPGDILTNALAPNQQNNIDGMGLTPSIVDITNNVSADPDKALLLSPSYLYNFANNVVPSFADNIYNTDQSWSGGSAPDIGFYDPTKPTQDPSQSPKVTVVKGNLSCSGNMRGGGILVVTGTLSGGGSFRFDGLILVIGTGEVNMAGWNVGLNGGMYIVNVTNAGGNPVFGTPKLTLSGNSNLYINSQALNMAVQLIPPIQLGWREIRNGIDP